MIIEIKDIAKNIKKITLEFDNDGEIQTFVENNNSQIREEYKTDEKPLDLNFGDTKSAQNISSEIMKKPEIPDKKREAKISDTMQGLKI